MNGPVINQIVQINNPTNKNGYLSDSREWVTYIGPAVVWICQILSIGALYLVMRTLTTNMYIAAAYGLFIGMIFSALVSLLFSTSALTSKGVSIILHTPGGMFAVVVLLAICATLYKMQPVLWRNGYTRIEAAALTVIAQLPLALSTSVFSAKFLNRIFNSRRYQAAMDMLLRERRQRRRIEYAAIVQNAIRDVMEITKDTDAKTETAQILSDAHLRACAMTDGLLGANAIGQKYLRDDTAAQLYQAVSDALKTLPYAQQTAVPVQMSTQDTHEFTAFLENS